jgi:hypothetical protein
MKDERLLAGLIAKRAQLAGIVEATQMTLRQAVADLDALDATIRVFDPDMDLEEIRPKALPPRHAGFKGEVSRAVLRIVREAKKPLSAREIAIRIMGERGLSTADRLLVRVIKQRVGACLRHWRGKETVRSVPGEKAEILWEVARL